VASPPPSRWAKATTIALQRSSVERCRLTVVGTFDWHSDVNDLPGVAGPGGLAAFGLWISCGAWTSRNGRTGFIPTEVVDELAGSDQDSIDRLVQAGLWQPAPAGYTMLRGPSSDPDLPLPLWRYGDGPAHRLFEVDDTPNT